jgi:hypothetical protein
LIQAFAFYLFATFVIVSGALTVLSRNPVHSVLWLILAFFNAAGLMLILGAEFIAMLLVIVYVGAVAVLFLFVVMMLDIDFAAFRAGVSRYWPAFVVLAIVLLAEIGFAVLARDSGGIAIGAARRADGPWPVQHPGARRGDVHTLPLCLRGRGAGAAGGHDRRHRADASSARRRPGAEHFAPGPPPPAGCGAQHAAAVGAGD